MNLDDLRPQRLSVQDDLPITLEDAQLDLRVDSDDDSATVERIILGASDYLERRTGYCMRPGSYRVLLPSFWPAPGPAVVTATPLRGDVEISYLSASNTWTTLDAGDFRISERGRQFAIYFTEDFDTPDLYAYGDAVRIDFEAGYDPPDQSQTTITGAMPDGLQRTLMGVVAYQYGKREAGRDTLRFSDLELDPMLGAYRTFW